MSTSWEEQQRIEQQLQQQAEAEQRAAEAARKAAEAKKNAQKNAAASSKPQNNRAAIKQAARTAQPQQRENGLITQIGSALQSFGNQDYLNDGLNAVAAGINQITPQGSPLKGLTQKADDNIRSSAELNAINQQRENEVRNSNSLVDKASAGLAANAEAAASGIKAGVALPFTLAARLANQNAPWSDPPAVVKDSPVGESVFQIAQVLTPTLLTGGLLGGAAPVLTTGATGLAVESAVETIPQDSADDLIAGRTIAEHFGYIADHLGYDGAQLTRDLIEGKTVQSQALVAGVGFLQNYGINFSADKLFRYFGENVFKGFRNTDDAARVLGRKSDDVAKSIDDVHTPLYDKLSEPHDVSDVDSTVPVSKPSKGREFVNDEALIQQALSRKGIAEDGLTNADRAYFTNWSAVNDDNAIQNILREATSTLKKLKGFPEDLNGALGRASKWWSENRSLIDDNLDAVVHNFHANMVDELRHYRGVSKLATNNSIPKDKLIDQALRHYSAANEEGFIAASLVAEELGIRIQKLARQAINLDEAFNDSVDFESAVENLLQLHEKANLFLIPLRRAKRKWALDGAIQQKDQLKRVKDADIKGSVKEAEPVSINASGKEFVTIKTDEADPGQTLRQLWDAYKEGDDAAGATLKTYLRLVAYSDPSTAVKQVNDLSGALVKQLHKGNKDAVSNLFYAWMLSRPATQVASAASNFSRLIAEPIGAILSGEKAYGLGQLVGGFQGMSEAHKVLTKALKDGLATNSGTKIENLTKDLAQEHLRLDQLYVGAMKQLNENGASPLDKFLLTMGYKAQKAANNPLIATPGRLLLSQDEWTKSIVGSQIATGRAFKEAAESGIKTSKDNPEFVKLLNDHMKEVFRDGIQSGKIIDADVLRVAKNVTFQEEIPINGNFVDNAFLAVQQAADNSAVWKFISPFTRISHSVLEVGARYTPGGLFAKTLPKYKEILAGKLGETAKIQLESQIAFGTHWTGMVTLASIAGFVTGVNSERLPKQSFILPAANKDGYIAIPYKKLEPFATITSIVADSVAALRDDIISQGEYDRAIGNVVFGIGMATFDKTFMTGMADFGSLFDAKNLSEGSLTGLGNIISTASPGVLRSITDILNPYQTIGSQTGDTFTTMLGQIKGRALGGLGNPRLYDELTGKPLPKVNTALAGDDESAYQHFALSLASLFNEFAFPGRITNAAKADPVKQWLDKVNFKVDTQSSIKTFEGISLNPQQQSILSKDLHDVGNLRGKLEEYFDSDDFKRLYNQLQATRREDGGLGVLSSSDEGTRANTIREAIHSQIRAIRRQAKLEAATNGRLANDADFQRKRLGAMTTGEVIDLSSQSDWKGLLSWTNK